MREPRLVVVETASAEGTWSSHRSHDEVAAKHALRRVLAEHGLVGADLEAAMAELFAGGVIELDGPPAWRP